MTQEEYRDHNLDAHRLLGAAAWFMKALAADRTHDNRTMAQDWLAAYARWNAGQPADLRYRTWAETNQGVTP